MSDNQPQWRLSDTDTDRFVKYIDDLLILIENKGRTVHNVVHPILDVVWDDQVISIETDPAILRASYPQLLEFAGPIWPTAAPRTAIRNLLIAEIDESLMINGNEAPYVRFDGVTWRPGRTID